MRQRHRQAQLLAYRREGIYIEEEYREDICYYMHEMEVRSDSSFVSMNALLNFEGLAFAEVHHELRDFHGPTA